MMMDGVTTRPIEIDTGRDCFEIRRRGERHLFCYGTYI